MHEHVPPIGQHSRAVLYQKLNEHDDALNALEQAGPAAQLEVFQAPNGEASSLLAGQLVATHDGFVYRGDNTSVMLSSIQGVVIADAGATLPTSVQCDGAVTLTVEQWDAGAGTNGGLTPGARYYLGTSGQLTTTAPTTPGTCSVAIGRAINATTLILRIQPYVYL